MPKAKVIVDFSTNRYSDLELKNKADNIVICLTDNPKFVTLAPKAMQIKTQVEDFDSLLARMAQGNKQLTLAKNQSRNVLENSLGSAAIQVQDLSAGDEELIVSAGFDVKRKPTPVGMLERPDNVKANPGPTRGSLEISWNVVPGAYMYEMEYTESPRTADSKTSRISTTKHKAVLDSLVRGQAYAIQVAAAGSDPGRVWSDEIISYVMYLRLLKRVHPYPTENRSDSVS
jgi:hypothetical protein